MIIDTQYDLGDIVFIKTDTEQRERMITEICVKSPNHLIYQLTHGINCSWHCEFEFQKELDLQTKYKK